MSRLRKLSSLLGLDKAVLFTVFARGWASIAGIVTILLIARFLTSAEQGYYYTFGSLVALQIIFELGFSYVIQQMASHECVHLTIVDGKTITGSPVAHARLASVLQKSVRWYTIAAIFLVCSLIPAGFYFFSIHVHTGLPVQWRLPWLCVCITASLGFQIDPIFSFLEGCGYLPEVAQTRFTQAVTGSILAWTALLLHHGLFAPAMLIAGQVLAGGYYLVKRRRLITGLLSHNPDPHRIQWWQEVWPFQWRIAVSWLSGYFIFQLFVPVLFVYWGPVSAGQMGMSLSIVNAIVSVSVSWISTKSPLFGSLVARKDWKNLDRIFFRTLIQSTAVCGLGVSAAWGALVYMNYRNIPLAHRILGPLPFGILLLCILINHVVFAEALYLRSHKQEKFLVISVAVAVCMTASSYLLGRPFGAMGMVIGYLCINGTVGLGAGTFIFMKYRRLWHAD